MKLKKHIILGIMLFSAPFFMKAEDHPYPKSSQAFDLALGAGSGMMTGSLSWNRTHGVFAANKFRLGYGLRFSGVSGSNLTYITAPANLTSKPETIDSIVVASPTNLALNSSIHIEYLFSPKLRLGFNIDAIGIGFGSKSNVDYISRNNDGSFPNTLEAKPNSFNALLVGDNDLGYLKSEFYVGYAISSKTSLRGGMDMTFAEYTTNQKLANENNRFRIKPVMFFLGVSFNPFN
jgi:hypothetical protein